MDYVPPADPNATETNPFDRGYIRVPGDEVDCLACQVSGPWSAADGSVVYVAPVARHNHKRSPYPRSEELQLWDEEPA